MHQMSKSWFGKAGLKATGGLARLRRLPPPPSSLYWKKQICFNDKCFYGDSSQHKASLFLFRAQSLSDKSLNDCLLTCLTYLSQPPNKAHCSCSDVAENLGVYFLTTGLQLDSMTQKLATLYLVNLNQRHRCSPAKRSLLSDSDNNEGTVHMSPGFLLHFNAPLNI